MPPLSPQSVVLKDRDFRFVGIIWYVRVRQGWRSEFYCLADLQRNIADGRLQKSDELSYDREDWIPLNQIPDLAAHFEDIWDRAHRGDLKVRLEIGRDRGFDENEHTRIVSTEEIQKALADIQAPQPPLEALKSGELAFTLPDDPCEELSEGPPMEMPGDGLEDSSMFEAIEDEVIADEVVADEPPAKTSPPAPRSIQRSPVVVVLGGVLAALAMLGIMVYLGQ